MEYYDVYKTKDNRWASPYAWLAYYLCKFREDCVLPVKPQKILFEKEVSFDLSVYSDMEYIKRRYPSPYFDIKDNRAIAVYGHYLEDLLKLSEENFYSRGFIYENRKNTNSNTGYY
jgi:hypothetical protein